MGEDSPTMSQSAIDEFLDTHGVGVLALADESVPYAIPVSYAFDENGREVFLRLGNVVEGEKSPFLETPRPGRMVVYETHGESAKSVVVDGRLESIPKADLTPSIIESLAEGEHPYFDLWPASKSDIEFEIFRLAPERLTGRSGTAE